MKQTLARSTPGTQFDVDELLSELIKMKVVLTVSKRGRIIPWPGSKLSLRIRTAISQQNGELQKLMNWSDPRLCPNWELHNHAEIYAVMRWCCPVCAQLAPYVNRKAC